MIGKSIYLWLPVYITHYHDTMKIQPIILISLFPLFMAEGIARYNLKNKTGINVGHKDSEAGKKLKLPDFDGERKHMEKLNKPVDFNDPEIERRNDEFMEQLIVEYANNPDAPHFFKKGVVEGMIQAYKDKKDKKEKEKEEHRSGL